MNPATSAPAGMPERAERRRGAEAGQAGGRIAAGSRIRMTWEGDRGRDRGRDRDQGTGRQLGRTLPDSHAERCAFSAVGNTA